MKLVLFLMIFFNSCVLFAQTKDTVFHKIDKKNEITVLKTGLDYLYIAKYNEKVDTVLQWEYAAYMEAYIYDALIDDDKFIVLHTNHTVIAYAVYEYRDKKWHPFMGGVLRTSGQFGEKIVPSIISKNKFKILTDGKATIYRLEYSTKTLELSN